MLDVEVVPSSSGQQSRSPTPSVRISDSQYRDGLPEGVVVRNTRSRTKAKLITEQFAEQHGQSTSKDHDNGDHSEFLDRFATRRRVEKRAQALIDSPKHDYEAIQLEMMEVMATEVWEDAWSEGWAEIIYENWELDIGELRSSTSSRTASFLSDLMKDQAVVDPTTGETAGEHIEGD
jgi:hypothetical protein